MQNKTSEPRRLIRINEVVKLTGISKSYIYKLVSQSQFPKAVQLVSGGTSVAWVESEVSSWIDRRILDRDKKVVTQITEQIENISDVN